MSNLLPNVFYFNRRYIRLNPFNQTFTILKDDLLPGEGEFLGDAFLDFINKIDSVETKEGVIENPYSYDPENPAGFYYDAELVDYNPIFSERIHVYYNVVDFVFYSYDGKFDCTCEYFLLNGTVFSLKRYYKKKNRKKKYRHN